jgi:hypothetical protein
MCAQHPLHPRRHTHRDVQPSNVHLCSQQVIGLEGNEGAQLAETMLGQKTSRKEEEPGGEEIMYGPAMNVVYTIVPSQIPKAMMCMNGVALFNA